LGYKGGPTLNRAAEGLTGVARHLSHMLSTSTRVTTSKNASAATRRGVNRYILDGCQKGFNVAQEDAPVGATGFLKNQSAIEPTQRDDGSVYWGFGAEYADDVNYGTAPHWIPNEVVRTSLMDWARRVLGNEDAAWGVRQKIAERGTEAQPFFTRGLRAMRDWFRASDPGRYVERELEGE